MTLVQQKRVSPLDEFEYEERPYDVRGKFMVYVPKPRNKLLEILLNHTQKQNAKSSGEGILSVDALDKRSVTPQHTRTSFYSSSSKLRGKLSDAFSDARRIDTQGASISETRSEINEQEVQAISPPVQQLELEIVGENPGDQIEVSNINQETNKESHDEEKTEEGAKSNPKQEETTHAKQDAKESLQRNPSSKEDIQNKFHVSTKVVPKSPVLLGNNSKTEPEVKGQILPGSGSQESSPSKAATCSKQAIEGAASPQNKKTNIFAPKKLAFPAGSSAETKARTSEAFRIKQCASPKSTLVKPKKFTLDDVMNEKFAIANNQAGSTVYETANNISPSQVISKRRFRPIFAQDNAVTKSLDNQNFMSTKYFQYDHKTRSHVGALLKEKVANDVRKYEDVILGSPNLLSGLLKLRDMHLLSQNPVLIRRYQEGGKLNFANSGHHQKNTNPGFSRNVFGGFYKN